MHSANKSNATPASIPSNLRERYVSPAQGEKISPFSRWTLRGWAYRGTISSVKVGGPKGRLLIPVAEIERVIAEGTRPRAESTAAQIA